MFDRKTVTIPTRHVERVMPAHGLIFDNEVFEDLVQGMADMDAAVRVRRPVMEHIPGLTGRLPADSSIRTFGFPVLEHLRLTLSQIGLHRERSLRQV